MKRYIVKKKVTLTFDIVAKNKDDAMAKASDDSKYTDYMLHTYSVDEVKQ